jgi:hypothetical protein
MKENSDRSFLFASVIIFLSRLPFITVGYGSEEDAWGLALTADRIAASHAYEVSRLPGHPFQEIIYALIHNSGFLLMNMLTLLISTAGVYAFMCTLRLLKISAVIPVALALAFTPVIYINSYCVMDYTWALTGILASFYFLCRRKYIASGLLLGLAVGCRITSGAMLLPFVIYMILSEDVIPLKNISAFLITVLAAAALCFLPVYIAYGSGFFTYYEHFPIPAMAKNIYKGTIGVAGTTGLLAIGIAWLAALPGCFRIIADKQHPHRPLVWLCITAIVLYVIAFIRMPLKSAFLIPAMPFVIIVPALVISSLNMRTFATAMIASGFLFGVNLSDPDRGNKPSAWSFTKIVNHQPVSFDILKGPVIADHEKQQTLIAFSDSIISSAKKIAQPATVIAGWYLNFIEYRKKHQDNPLVKYVYYIDADSMDYYRKQNILLYYLPLQDKFNDIRFKINTTALKAKPFPA